MITKEYYNKIKKFMISNNLKLYKDEYLNSFNNYVDKQGNNYVDYIALSALPKKKWNGKLSIDWKKVKNISVDCLHKNKNYKITIVKALYENEPKVQLKSLLVKHGNKHSYRTVSTIRNSKLNFLSNTFNKDFKFEIGDIVANCTILEKKRLESSYEKMNTIKGYRVKCNYTDIIFDWDESSLTKRKFSPHYNRLTVNENNCLWNKRPDLRPYIKDVNYAKTKTTPYSRKNKIELVCPNCKTSKKYKVKDLPKCYNCSSCSDSTPFTEKLFESILRVNNIKYEKQKRFEDCKNILELPFDFFIEDYNILVEIMGLQHFDTKSGFSNTESLSNIQKRDRIKKEYCDKNNIKLIYVDAKKSDYDYIISSIQNTELINILDVFRTDEIKKILLSVNKEHKYPIEKIISLVDSGYNYKEVTDILNNEGYDISRHTVSRKYNNFKKD